MGLRFSISEEIVECFNTIDFSGARSCGFTFPFWFGCFWFLGHRPIQRLGYDLNGSMVIDDEFFVIVRVLVRERQGEVRVALVFVDVGEFPVDFCE